MTQSHTLPAESKSIPLPNIEYYYELKNDKENTYIKYNNEIYIQTKKLENLKDRIFFSTTTNDVIICRSVELHDNSSPENQAKNQKLIQDAMDDKAISNCFTASWHTAYFLIDLEVRTHNNRHYIKSRNLGKGSYGEVYLWESLDSKDTLAIKEIPMPTKPLDENNETNYVKELQETSDLAVREADLNLAMYGIGEVYINEDKLHIIMPYFTGIKLYDLWNSINSVTHYLQLCMAFFIALDEMHEKKIAHRDCHLNNGIVQYNEFRHSYHVKMIDFGFSQRFNDNGDKLVKTGFTAPETEKSTPVLPSEDAYTAGKVFADIHKKIKLAKPDHIFKPFPVLDAYLGRFYANLTKPDVKKRHSISDAIFTVGAIKGHVCNGKDLIISASLKSYVSLPLLSYPDVQQLSHHLQKNKTLFKKDTTKYLSKEQLTFFSLNSQDEKTPSTDIDFTSALPREEFITRVSHSIEKMIHRDQKTEMKLTIFCGEPSPISIQNYLLRFNKFLRIKSNKTFCAMMVYLQRQTEKGELLHPDNMHRLIAACFLLATHSEPTHHFSLVMGESLENLIQYNLKIREYLNSHIAVIEPNIKLQFDKINEVFLADVNQKKSMVLAKA